MDINIGMLGQGLTISLALTVIGTIWFARRQELHNPAMSILVVFAWLVPVFGPTCLLTVLATRKSASEVAGAEHGTT
ncbi:MAG: hypothetical protein KJO95_05990 [Gammaproteobacteria bacterium]|nr:hypothetical protein [Gammaproteobacteria bacterium]